MKLAPSITKEQAEKLIVQHLTRPGNLALAPTPGTGKTYNAITGKAIPLARKQIVIYAMPQHSLVEEWADKTKALNPGIPIRHFKGRDKTDSCKKIQQVKDASARGFYPAQTVCSHCELHPSNKRSPLVCSYYRQFTEIRASGHGLILCTTHQLPYLINDKIGEIGTIFVDEQPLQAIVQKEKGIPVNHLQFITSLMNPKATATVRKILNAAEDLHRELKGTGGPHAVGRLYTAKPGGTWWSGRPTLWDFCETEQAEARTILGAEVARLLSGNQYEQFKGRLVNRKALLWLQQALEEKGTAWIQADNTSSQALLCFLKKVPLPPEIDVIVLDATLSKGELRGLFDRDFDRLELEVGWEGRRVHIQKSLGKHAKQNVTDKQFRKISDLLKRYIQPSAKTWLLCTHKKDEALTLARLRREIPTVEWLSSHYFAERGENKYEHVDGVFCYGLPIWNPDEMGDYAAFLFPDERIEQIEWLEAQNDAEILQKVHRARFVRHPGKTLIVAGYHWPSVLGEPDEVIDLTRKGRYLDEAVARALAVRRAIGFVDKYVAALMGIGVKGDEEKLREIQVTFKKIMDAASKDGMASYPILNKMVLSGMADRDTLYPIALPKRKTWRALLDRIEDNLGGGFFDVKLPDWGHTWCLAGGKAQDATAFYSELARAALASEIPCQLPTEKDVKVVQQPAGSSDHVADSVLKKCA